jgi:glucosamine 6-phosphate synthetase-like amidotransferase/phosphosugar isomerase protein
LGVYANGLARRRDRRRASRDRVGTARLEAAALARVDDAGRLADIGCVDPQFPVWVIASLDESLPAVVEAAAQARATGATLLASGSAASEIAGASYVLPVPEAPLPVLAPLLSVVPGQLFAGALARAKGLDPDHPAGLSKVTLAR